MFAGPALLLLLQPQAPPAVQPPIPTIDPALWLLLTQAPAPAWMPTSRFAGTSTVAAGWPAWAAGTSAGR